MPANVETMFYTGETPWHRLGTYVADAPDSEAALVAAGLAWAVESDPVYTAEGFAIPGYRLNRRVTDGAVLGVVTDSYRIVQNREAFAFADALLGEGARFETAGSLAGGRRVWLTTRLPDTYKVLDDPAVVYLTITNGHDGRHAFQAVVSPVRVVCQNTLTLALARARRTWSVIHTARVADHLQAARDALALTAGYLKALDRAAADLAAKPLTLAEWHDLVDGTLVPRPAPGERERPSTAAFRETLRAAFDRPDHAAFARTGWAAVNAVAWAVSHRPATGRSPERPMVTFLDGDALFGKVLDVLGAGV